MDVSATSAADCFPHKRDVKLGEKKRQQRSESFERRGSNDGGKDSQDDGDWPKQKGEDN